MTLGARSARPAGRARRRDADHRRRRPRAAAGRVLGLVGESGSGKTTTALALLGYARPGTRIAAGTVAIAGERAAARRRARRAARCAAARSRTSPRIRRRRSTRRCGSAAPCRRCSTCTAASAQRACRGLLAAVGLPSDERLPAALSARGVGRPAAASGDRDRARVRAARRRARRADDRSRRHHAGARARRDPAHPATEFGIALVYVSHDLAVVAEIADEIAVLYAGRVVEHGPTAELLARARATRTRAACSTRSPITRSPRRLVSMRGIAAGVGDWPQGCAFEPRCDQAVPRVLASRCRR